MAKIRPFRVLHPRADRAAEVASPPYDVMSTAEAREMVAAHPHSFLRVIRAEVDFPQDADPYSDEVYQKGGETLRKYQEDGVMLREPKPCFYLYRQKMGEHVQTGIVATVSCQEYDANTIRKHEYTRPDKEADRTRHIEQLGAQTGPVWLAYRAVDAIDAMIDQLTAGAPESHFVAPDGIEHSYWPVKEEAKIEQLTALFQEQVSLLYIADGHHRSAAASRVAAARRDKGSADDAPDQFFLTVIYPDNQLQILPYNRYVHDLNGLSQEAFLEALKQHFTLSPLDGITLPSPPEAHQFDMYLGGSWYRLVAKADAYDANDPIDSLDVQILQKHVLHAQLGIDDPRTNKRIDFIGGIRGHKELVKRVDAEGGVAFACYATTMAELFAVADADKVMPPKSTWFEPKLRSGLFVNLLDD